MPKNADRTDWARIRALTEDEIERMAAADADNPATEEADWAEATVGLPPRKTRIHATVDATWSPGSNRTAPAIRPA
jgi:hypothetical protein